MSVSVRTVPGTAGLVKRARTAAAATLADVLATLRTDAVVRLRRRVDTGDRAAQSTAHHATIAIEKARSARRVELAGRAGVRTPSPARRRQLRAELATLSAAHDLLTGSATLSGTCAAAQDYLSARRESIRVEAASLLRVMIDRAHRHAARAWQHYRQHRAREQRVSLPAGIPRVQPLAPRAPALPMWAGLTR